MTMRNANGSGDSCCERSGRSALLSPGQLLGEGRFLPLGLLALQGVVDARHLAGVAFAAIRRARVIVCDGLPVVADLVDLLAQDPGGDIDVEAGVVEMLLLDP